VCVWPGAGAELNASGRGEQDRPRPLSRQPEKALRPHAARDNESDCSRRTDRSEPQCVSHVVKAVMTSPHPPSAAVLVEDSEAGGDEDTAGPPPAGIGTVSWPRQRARAGPGQRALTWQAPNQAGGPRGSESGSDPLQGLTVRFLI
jgi:hypothetical protein